MNTERIQIQDRINNAFEKQYDLTLEIAKHFDDHGTELTYFLRLKVHDLENKIIDFKSLCDKHQDTHATLIFESKIITVYSAMVTIGGFVKMVIESTGYNFPKLRQYI